MEVRKTFHQQLDELYQDLLKMGNLTVEVIEKTRVAFRELDADKACEIIEGDDVIDDFVVKIEENGIELLARQAPVAIDLRRIIVIMRLSQHLERVADLCVNISKAIVNLQEYTLSPWISENMDEMFRRSTIMMVRAMESFKERDTEKAAQLSVMDDTVDRINRSFLLVTNRDSEDELELIIRVVMVSRFLERIADHAVDIGEHVRYMVTGEFEV
ncbi:MAG: phosphate signaling complex protein PhoU [Actinobacteria bacterium]|nr:phosphate signaling complex protein PhoU [Actinomycetota bacterium]MBU1945192.1 phosphate signaling complex protein PhoU [Actinomycetota bacterium]MBU2687730.1 phosphate signaling complex protein PhoU [Actinomycetota bacterium]